MTDALYAVSTKTTIRGQVCITSPTCILFFNRHFSSDQMEQDMHGSSNYGEESTKAQRSSVEGVLADFLDSSVEEVVMVHASRPLTMSNCIFSALCYILARYG